jgi:HAD superfamily hydrolase (TIGR01509 family)
MRNFRAVIFDMDGLLLDTERLALLTFNETCTEFGIGERTEVFIKLIGLNQALGDEVLRNELNGVVDTKDFGVVWEGKYEALTTREPVPLKAGVPELLSHLKRTEVPAAVATSTESYIAKDKLRNAGIFGYFDFIVGGDQVHKGKPDPEIFLKAASGLGVEPQDCIAVEDSENGVRAAVAAGMTVLQVPDLVPPSPELLRLGHTVLTDLHQVLELLSATRA